MIFEHATSKHLGWARVLVYSILLIDLLVDDLPALAAMPVEAFLPRGVLTILPGGFWKAFFQEGPLRMFAMGYGVVLLLGILGIGRSWVTTGAAILMTTLFHGVARGFGGHVNHQELIVLHALFFLMFPPAFDAVCLKKRKATGSADDDAATSRLLLRLLCFWIMLTYYYVGIARLQESDWRVYATNAMEFYGVTHSLKWNFWDIGLARNVLDQPWLGMAMKISFPLATVLELIAPLSLFYRKSVVPVVAALVAFHLSIWVCMNIFFWQNLLFLALPVLGWWVDRERVPVRRHDGRFGTHAITLL